MCQTQRRHQDFWALWRHISLLHKHTIQPIFLDQSRAPNLFRSSVVTSTQDQTTGLLKTSSLLVGFSLFPPGKSPRKFVLVKFRHWCKYSWSWSEQAESQTCLSSRLWRPVKRKWTHRRLHLFHKHLDCSGCAVLSLSARLPFLPLCLCCDWCLFHPAALSKLKRKDLRVLFGLYLDSSVSIEHMKTHSCSLSYFSQVLLRVLPFSSQH